ncbi:hypothetical protein PBI_DEWDROP_94 [Microbacterium phage Dewdrop]|nr:hypothetical protein PBI_LEAF_94 [Microbacterium phage Leaf]QGZ17462.1 hypothetical protein PBI_DEWDROP_94 [Microbacterium phage Dewdrop]
MRIQLAVKRKSGYMSTYSLRMFYGAWRASRYFAKKHGSWAATPHIQIGDRDWRRIPDGLMIVFRPFNKYRATMRGERFY